MFKAFGAEVERRAQVLKRLPSFAKRNFNGGEVVPWFRLVRDDGDQFFKCAFEFGQIAGLREKLGDDANFSRGNVRTGQCLVKQPDDAIGLLHLKISAGEVEDVLEIGRVGARLVFHALQLGFELNPAGGLFFHFLQLLDEAGNLAIIRVEIGAGLGNEDGIIKAVKHGQKVDVAKNSFGAVRTKSKRLFEGKIRFPDQFLPFSFVFRQILGRCGHLAQRPKAPRVKAGDGTA